MADEVYGVSSRSVQANRSNTQRRRKYAESTGSKGRDRLVGSIIPRETRRARQLSLAALDKVMVSHVQDFHTITVTASPGNTVVFFYNSLPLVSHNADQIRNLADTQRFRAMRLAGCPMGPSL